MSEWFYLKGDEKNGPVSSEELRQLTISGKIERMDMVWKDGMGDWVAASSVKGLFASQPPPPPAMKSTPPPAPAATSQISMTIPKASPLMWGLRGATFLLLIATFFPWFGYHSDVHANTNYGSMRQVLGGNTPNDVNYNTKADVSLGLSAVLATFIWIFGIGLIVVSFLERKVPWSSIIIPGIAFLLFILVLSAMIFGTPTVAGGQYEASNEFGSAGAEASASVAGGAWLGFIFVLAVLAQAILINLKALLALVKRPASVAAVVEV